MKPSSNEFSLNKILSPEQNITLEEAKKYLSPKLGKNLLDTQGMSYFGKVWTHIKTVAFAKRERMKRCKETGEWYDNAAICQLISKKIKALSQLAKDTYDTNKLMEIQAGAREVAIVCELLEKSGAKQVQMINNSVMELFKIINTNSSAILDASLLQSNFKSHIEKSTSVLQTSKPITLKKINRSQKALDKALEILTKIKTLKIPNKKEIYTKLNEEFQKQQDTINKFLKDLKN